MTVRKINKIRKNYDKLTNPERLRLVANAIIRDDEDEYEALVNSTPRKTYTMRDAWMGERHEALWRIGVVYWLCTEELLRKKAEDQHLESILLFDAPDLMEREEDNPRKVKREKALKLIDFRINEHDNLIWAHSEAVKRLATMVALTPEELLAYLPVSTKERLEWPRHDYNNDDDEVNLQGLIDEYFKVFSGHWPGLTESEKCA